MFYTVDVQVNDTKIIALIINDHGEELFRGEFGYHLEDKEKMVDQVIKGTEATLLQIKKNIKHTYKESCNPSLIVSNKILVTDN